MKQRGFTLIELLTVISIISLLASIVVSSLQIAKVRGVDARIKEEVLSVQNALELFYDQNGAMPNSLGPSCETGNAAANYASAMKQLVDGGFMGSIPHSPNASPYCYNSSYHNSPSGALFGAHLDPSEPKTLGGTCSDYAKLGDGNSDGYVDSNDMAGFSTSYGQHQGDPLYNSVYDLNQDGAVDVSDLGLMSSKMSITFPCNQMNASDFCVCVKY